MRAVVNFAKAAPWPNTWYPRGQARLKQSLSDVGYADGLLCYNDEHQVNCPPHDLMPYAFKVGALNRAVESGYTTLLWCDASVWAIKPLNPIFDYIEKHGHVFFMAGFNCAQWTNDRALEILSVSRDEAEKMPMLMALCFGIDVRHERSKLFLERLTAYVLETESVRGQWTNNHQTESRDPRCLGHRHDQSVASIVAARLGMELSSGHETFLSYYGPSIFEYGAVNDMSQIKDSVLLLAQGMMA